MTFPKGIKPWVWTPKRIAEAERSNDERLRAARNQWGCLDLRIETQIRCFGVRGPDKRNHTKLFPAGGFAGLRHHAFMVRVPEVVDVFALVHDMRRFLESWRPMRIRSEAGKREAERILEAWEKLSR